MKTVFISILIVAVALIVLLAVFAAQSRSGKPPGLVAGRLSACPDKPNCVSTEQGTDSLHYLAPVAIQQAEGADPVADISNIILAMGGAVQQRNGAYIAAVFTSSVFGFADDLEVRVDQDEGVIHMRSASRAGYGDFGVNRKRVERLKKLYAGTAVREVHNDS